MANELSTGAGTGNTVYAHVLNSAKRRWNGTAFEVYSSSNYPNYTIAMTEQGISGVYVGDFPSGVTDSGSYEIYYYIRQDVSPAEGDPVAGVGSVTWDGSSATTEGETVSGELSGSSWYSYLIRTFKRTDKSVEAFDATNEAIAEIRREIRTAREEKETALTDQISTLGEYKMDLESDFSSFVSDIFIRDSGDGYYLIPISKTMFDNLYSKWGTGSSERGRPRHYCVFSGQILVGPIPDSTAYTYVISYTKDDGVLVTSVSASVPFTKPDYREILKFGALWRMFKLVENDDQAAQYKGLWDDGLMKIERKERHNRRPFVSVAYRDC
jgi:hypothetical protein